MKDHPYAMHAKNDNCTTLVRASSNEVRNEFQKWLVSEFNLATKLVIVEGLTGSGKTTLTNRPFDLEDALSANIEADDFLPSRVPEAVSYLEALNELAMWEAVELALRRSVLVILQGAVVWPVIVRHLEKHNILRVRRVYLKRMAHQIPDYWQDEKAIFDSALWPPSGFHRSIYKYHSEMRPWTQSDLVIERIEQDHFPQEAL